METAEKLNFLTTLLPLVGVLFIIAMGVVLLMQQFRKNLYRQKLAKEELIIIHQQELLRSSITVQEEERKRIATDIHDELGAVLSIARMHLMALENQSHKNQEDILALQNIRSLLETSISSVRRISHELMPQNLQMFGLQDTLQSIVAMVNSSDNLKIQIDCDEDVNHLPWSVKLGLYRICLELINNTIKHAKATHIDLTIHCKNNALTLFYADDGIGLSDNFEKFGLGHKNIEARTMSIGGNLKVGNNKTGGFYAHIEIADANIQLNEK